MRILRILVEGEAAKGAEVGVKSKSETDAGKVAKVIPLLVSLLVIQIRVWCHLLCLFLNI